MATDLAKCSKRELTFEQRSDVCSKLDDMSMVSETVSNIADSCSSIPGVETVAIGVSIISKVFSAGIDVASTSVDCDSLPFDEIKEILDTKFKEMERKLDENTEILKEVHEKVTKTLLAVEDMRIEMKHQFKQVLGVIRNSRIVELTGKINNFIESFEKEKKLLSDLDGHLYKNKLEEEGYLDGFRQTKTPVTDRLSEQLHSLINENLTVPESKDNKEAFSALQALFYGTEAYIEVMYFLIEKYTYLADYYYQERNLEKYNENFMSMLNNFSTFKVYLTGDEGIIAKVRKVAETNAKLFDEKMKEELHKYMQDLLHFQSEINHLNLRVLADTPGTVERVQFNLPIAKHGHWEKAHTVRYAVQFQRDNMYSIVSKWSNDFPLTDKANPTLHGLPLPERRLDPNQKTKKLIFRQIDDNTPQLVGMIKGNEKKYTDIDRDLYDAAGNSNIEFARNEIKQLLSLGANINAEFDNGRRAIHMAASSNNKEIALDYTSILNKNGTNINAQDKMGFSPLHIAVKSNSKEFFSMLLGKGADVNMQTKSGYTPLHLAVKYEGKMFARRLIEKENIDVNKKDHNGLTALHLAIPNYRHHESMIEILVSSDKLKVNKKNKLGLTPFHLAVMMEYDEYFEGRLNALLLNPKVNVNIGNDENMTALHFACFGENGLKKVKYLLRLPKIDVNTQTTNNKWTPIHLALVLRKYDIALELLSVKGLKFDLPDNNGVTPLNAAVATGNIAIVQNLLGKKANANTVTNEGFTLLHTAALRNDKNIISILPFQKLDSNAKSISGLTPLHLAISRNNTETAKVLLEHNANVEEKTKDGYTALHLSAIKGGKELVEVILERKANINAKTTSGDTPLHLAAANGNLQAFRCLIEKGADINLRDGDNHAYYEDAVINGHVNVLKYAIDNSILNLEDTDTADGPNKNRTKKYIVMKTAAEKGQLEIVKYLVGTLRISVESTLYFAALNGQFDIVKYLVEEAHFDVNAPLDNDEKSYLIPLIGAIRNHNLDLVKYLVRKGANVNHTPHVFHYALREQQIPIMEYLIEKGADLTARFDGGYTYGFVAAFHCIECLKYLASRNLIDVNAQNDEGNTILHEFARWSDPKVVHYLCSIGANRTIRNNKNKTAYQIAKKAKNADKYSCLNPHSKTGFKRNNILLTQSNNNKEWFSSKVEKGEIKNQNYRNSFRNVAAADKKFSILNHSSLYSAADSSDSAAPGNYAGQRVNVDGVLMLMGLLLNSKKQKKRKLAFKEFPSENEAQILALKIAEKLEMMLNSFSDIAAEPQIDISKVHSDVFKAVKSGRINEIPNILKTSLKSIYAINDEQMDEILIEVFRK